VEKMVLTLKILFKGLMEKSSEIKHIFRFRGQRRGSTQTRGRKVSNFSVGEIALSK